MLWSKLREAYCFSRTHSFATCPLFPQFEQISGPAGPDAEHSSLTLCLQLGLNQLARRNTMCLVKAGITVWAAFSSAQEHFQRRLLVVLFSLLRNKAFP